MSPSRPCLGLVMGVVLLACSPVGSAQPSHGAFDWRASFPPNQRCGMKQDFKREHIYDFYNTLDSIGVYVRIGRISSSHPNYDVNGASWVYSDKRNDYYAVQLPEATGHRICVTERLADKSTRANGFKVYYWPNIRVSIPLPLCINRAENPIHPLLKETTGLDIPLNINDDDTDSVADLDDNYIPGGDPDLVKLQVRNPSGAPVSITIDSNSGGDIIRLYERQTKKYGDWEDGIPARLGDNLVTHVPYKGFNDTDIYVEGIRSGTTFLNVIGSGGIKDRIKINVASAVDLIARRPCTEGPEFDNPFDEHEVPEDKEKSPGAGIRVNGDGNEGANENDLIKVELKVDPFPLPSGVTYVLKRNNSSIRVWDSRTMGTAILDSGTEATITFSAATKTVWVENPSGGDADLELIARSGSTDVCSDKIHFYDFTGIVVVFGGKDQVPNDPPDANEGMFMVATNLYGLGYDIHMYFANDDQDAAFNEIVAAVQHRQVNNVAIFGYSWGGDETQEVAYRLDTGRAQIGTFSIRYTAYVDAVEELSGPQENLPLGTACHDNYYQTLGYLHGVLIQGSRTNVDVATLDPAVTHAHGVNDPPPDHSIDNNATVRVNIAAQLISQMDP